MQSYKNYFLWPIFLLAGLVFFFLSYEIVYENIINMLPAEQVDLAGVKVDLTGKLAFAEQEMEIPDIDDHELTIGDLLRKAAPILPDANFVVRISIADQKMCIEAYGNRCAREYPVSTGENKTPTPIGDFKIWFKEKLRVSGGETPYRMPNYMSLKDSGEYGLHALPYLGNTTTGSDFWHEALWHIGIPVSHGCVRLLPEHSNEIFEMIPVDTPVFIRSESLTDWINS